MADRIRAAGEHPVVYGVATGRFAAERAHYWAERYQADPVGTARTIDAMAPILATESARWLAGAAATAPAAADAVDEFADLFPPTPEQFDAAQAARMARIASMSDEELEAELFGPRA